MNRQRTLRMMVLFCLLLIGLSISGCADDSSDVAPRVHQLLSADPYPAMELHVDWVEDRKYRQQAADRLVDGVDDIVDKPAGIHLVEGDELAPSAPESGWEFSQLRNLVESRASQHQVSDGAIDIYTLFVDGEYNGGSEGGTVLGVAWSNRYVVLFRDEIERACQSRLGRVPSVGDRLCENAELTIWRHELGHVLGLVDTGAPTTSDHADPDHPAHCRHDDCVMYWAFRGPGALDLLRDRLDAGQSVPDFGSLCRDDLQAASSR